MTGSGRTRGFDGSPAEVNTTTIRNPRSGSDGTRTYLLRQPHNSNNEVGCRVTRGTRRRATFRQAAPQGHVKRLESKPRTQVGLHRPADDNDARTDRG